MLTFHNDILVIKEKFDLPTVAVEKCDILGCEIEVVGVVYERTSEVCCIIDNPSHICWVVPCVPIPREPYCLVKEYAVHSIKNVFRADDFEFRFPFLADDEECAAEMYSEKPCEVEIHTVKDIAGVGFVVNPLHSLVVSDFGVCDSVEYWNLGNDVNPCMYFDARLCATEERPLEDGHTEVDGSEVDCVKPTMQLKFFGNPPLLRERNHIEREVLEYPSVTEHVGLRKSVPDNGRIAEAKMIAPFCVGGGNVCELSESIASKKLPEDENKQVIPMRKTPLLCSVIEFGNNPAELPLWQIHCNLGKYLSSVVHLCSILSETKVRFSSPGQYLFLITKCA